MLNAKVICPKCENSRLLSIKKIKSYVEEKGFKFITATNVTDSKKCKISIVCPNGHARETSWCSFAYQDRRCNKGLCNEIGNKLRKELKDVISEFEQNGYVLVEGLGDYTNNKSPLTIRCKNNHLWQVSYNHFMKVRECPDCNGIQRHYKYKEVIELFENEGCSLLELEYINSKTPMKYQCVCGNENCKVRLTDFLRGVRCKRCANREPYTVEALIKLFETRGHTLIEREYKGVKDPYEYICKCGNNSKITISNLLNGNRCMKCYLTSNRGENHPNYNHDLTKEERQTKRKYHEYEHWRLDVLKRDNYTCQCCGDNRGGNLVVHHLDGYDWCKEKRVKVDNGVTLCERCHLDFHKEYKFGGNTKAQYDEWLQYNNKRI
ncbi:HNH endonuclease [Peribacillus sp. NPDC097197]|uniref:HNH endonuclease n=1 Tax=Peribacillus sp. NPDC097197 TaxID=3390615 RepID=UPI003D03EDAB